MTKLLIAFTTWLMLAAIVLVGHLAYVNYEVKHEVPQAAFLDERVQPTP